MNALIQLARDIPQTFYASSFYQDLLLTRKGIGFGFLLVASLIGLAQIHIAVMPEIRNGIVKLQPILEAFPELTFKDGAMSVQGETPQTFTFSSEENGPSYKIILDPGATLDNSAALKKKMEDEKIFIIAAQKTLALYDPSKQEVQLESYKDIKDSTITHENWVSFGKNIQDLVVPVSLFSLAGFLLIAHLFTAFLGAILILVICPLFKVDLPLSAAMRLASAAKVPVALVFVIVTHNMALQAALWFGFAAFGLLSARAALTRPA